MLTGTLYAQLGDSYIGLAGQCDAESQAEFRSRWGYIAKAELYIDRSRECFKKCSYLDGECEQLMKKALIAKLRGDEKLAEEWAQNHNRVWDENVQAIEGS